MISFAQFLNRHTQKNQKQRGERDEADYKASKHKQTQQMVQQRKTAMFLKNCRHAASSLLAVLTASLLVFSPAGVPVVASSWEEQEDKTHGETLPSLRGSQNDPTTMMQERRLPGFVVDRLNCFSAGIGTLVCN